MRGSFLVSIYTLTYLIFIRYPTYTSINTQILKDEINSMNSVRFLHFKPILLCPYIDFIG
jgi:hypothetical protein